MKQGATVTYLHGDHLGSTSVASTQSGAFHSRQTYYPFGAVRTTEGTLPTDYTFTGQKRDNEANLMFYNARYYDPGIGRFTPPDTIVPEPGNPQTLNRYSYVNNNPLRYVDPTGHDFWESLANFWGGFSKQFVYDNVAALAPQVKESLAAKPNEPIETTVGRHVGNAASIAQSVGEVVKGISTIVGGGLGGAATCLGTAGGGCAAGVVVMGAGAAVVAHGVATGVTAALEEGAMLGEAAKNMSAAKGKPSEIHKHHLLPQQGSLKAKFKDAGLDIEDYTVELPADFHYGIHGKGGGEKWKNSWNKKWERFFDENPLAGKDEILDQLNVMKVEFGIQ
ncbi:MAG: DUF2380 domain-containing protein [Chloroflexi bacterium]|nr:DUF2380 domain-containing protein [Chloroflexota bacterium]